MAEDRRKQRLKEETQKLKDGGQRLARTVAVPRRVTDLQALNSLIHSLQVVARELELYSEIEVTIEVKE